MKIRLLTYFLLLVPLFAGCDDAVSGFEEYGKETLSVTIKTSSIQTKSAKDGDEMNNLYLCLVRGGAVVRSIDSVNDADGGADDYVLISADGTYADVRFSEIPRGDYTLYTVANKPSSVALDFTSEADFQSIILSDIVDFRPGYGDSDGMPLSLVKKFSAGPGGNRVEAELLRVCGKIRVSVQNQIVDRNVFIESIGFDDKNPTSGYLFHRDDHSVPAGRTSFVRYTMGNSPFAITPSGSQGEGIIDQYIYESGSMRPFRLVINGAVYPESVTDPDVVDGAEETNFIIDQASDGFNTTDQYLIQSLASPQIYLYAQSNTAVVGKTEAELEAAKGNPDEMEKYLWTFSGTGTTGIRNVGNGRNINISTTNSPSVSLGTAANEFNWDNRTFYRSSGNYRYYLRNNGGTVSGSRSRYAQSGSQYRWQVRKVTRQVIPAGKRLSGYDKRFDWTIAELNYADQYGAPVPLESVCRNETLDIKVNVFYNDVLGKVYYEVIAWDVVDNDTTFD